jgi:hypothetical protein
MRAIRGEGALAQLQVLLSDVIDPAATGSGGHVFKSTGDGVLEGGRTIAGNGEWAQKFALLGSSNARVAEMLNVSVPTFGLAKSCALTTDDRFSGGSLRFPRRA